MESVSIKFSDNVEKEFLAKLDTGNSTTASVLEVGEYIEEGNVITKPANPTRNGYTFKQWTLNGQTYDFATPVTSEITLVAEWTKNESKPSSKPSTPGCTYGNKNYNTNKYILYNYLKNVSIILSTTLTSRGLWLVS